MLSHFSADSCWSWSASSAECHPRLYLNVRCCDDQGLFSRGLYLCGRQCVNSFIALKVCRGWGKGADTLTSNTIVKLREHCSHFLLKIPDWKILVDRYPPIQTRDSKSWGLRAGVTDGGGWVERSLFISILLLLLFYWHKWVLCTQILCSICGISFITKGQNTAFSCPWWQKLVNWIKDFPKRFYFYFCTCPILCQVIGSK